MPPDLADALHSTAFKKLDTPPKETGGLAADVQFSALENCLE
jgi:hypothetical protein